MADIASVIWVGAGAAKAAEVSDATIARTKKALAQNLATKEYTEEQGELWDVSVIGSLFWLVTTARNFSTHGNLRQRGAPIARKLHRSFNGLALIPLYEDDPPIGNTVAETWHVSPH